MIKPANIPTILSVEDYIELFGKPSDTFGEQDNLVLYRFIEQATNQFDSLISPTNQSGNLYKWWKALKNNDEDNLKGYKLQRAIGSWVETMVITGKFWVDNVPTMSSNIDYQIETSSKNSSVENKRKDIIQDLVSIGLTQTTNLNNGDGNVSDAQIEDLILVSNDYLNDTFLRLSSVGQKGILSPLSMNENPIINGGDISTLNTNKRKIINYKLVDCDISASNGNNITVDQTDKVLDTNDNLYKYINQFPISTWKGLTEAQINLRIQASGSLFSEDFIYQKGFITLFVKTIKKENEVYGWAESSINDNKGNDPNTSPDAWKILPLSPTDLNAILEFLKPYINNNVKEEVALQLDLLPTIENIVFHKNNIYSFDTLASFNETKLKFGILDKQYEVITNGSILGSGENGLVVGSDLKTIKQSDLPNVRKDWGITQARYVNGGDFPNTNVSINIQGPSKASLYSAGNKTTNFVSWFYDLNGNVEQTLLDTKPKYLETYMVKFLENITQKGIVKSGGSGGKTYNGVAPIIVNNTNDTISIDLKDIASKEELDITNTNVFNNKINIESNSRKISDNTIGVDKNRIDIKNNDENNKVKFDSISEVLTGHEKLIDKNILDINNNKKNIDQVILENKAQINFLGVYDSLKNYMKNDSVVDKDIYYISIIDNNKKPLSDTSAWFKTSPSVSIDLSNYYTKIETNNLLLPLEKRLNDIDIDSANQQIEIDTNKNNISLRYTKDETLNMLNQKLNSSYFDSTIRDYQKKLTAGKNITIDNNNVISATGGSEEVWENVSIQNTTQGFNILNIGNYKKIRIVSMDFLKIYTNIESDYMGSAISSNTIYLDENINQNIPLTTNESSPYCVGGYLLITSSGVCNFNVRFYKNGNFGNSSINSYVGTIKVKGVKK